MGATGLIVTECSSSQRQRPNTHRPASDVEEEEERGERLRCWLLPRVPGEVNAVTCAGVRHAASSAARSAVPLFIEETHALGSDLRQNGVKKMRGGQMRLGSAHVFLYSSEAPECRGQGAECWAVQWLDREAEGRREVRKDLDNQWGRPYCSPTA